MEYARLGDSGLNVSRICLGTMMFGRWGTAVLFMAILLASCGAPSGGSAVKATVYVDGAVDTVSAAALVIRDSEGRLVTIRLEHAEGPAEQFFRQASHPNGGLTLSQAAPQKGEALCVLAWLFSGGKLVSRKVFLESHCQHTP